MLKVYDGGSDTDDELFYMTENYTLTQVTSTGSQLFISLKNNGSRLGKGGFSASIGFSKYITYVQSNTVSLFNIYFER